MYEKDAILCVPCKRQFNRKTWLMVKVSSFAINSTQADVHGLWGHHHYKIYENKISCRLVFFFKLYHIQKMVGSSQSGWTFDTSFRNNKVVMWFLSIGFLHQLY